GRAWGWPRRPLPVRDYARRGRAAPPAPWARGEPPRGAGPAAPTSASDEVRPVSRAPGARARGGPSTGARGTAGRAPPSSRQGDSDREWSSWPDSFRPPCGCGHARPSSSEPAGRMLSRAGARRPAPAEEAPDVIAERLAVVEVVVEEGHPQPFLLRRAHGEDADIAAGKDEHRVARGRHVRAIGHERPHVLHRELVR